MFENQGFQQIASRNSNFQTLKSKILGKPPAPVIRRLATGLFINIHKMASPVFCGIFGSVIWLLAQSGAKLNGIIPKPLPVFSESFTTIT